MVKYIWILALFINATSHAATIQEGWYRIFSGGQHVGFILQRVEYDEKKKLFTFTSYTQTGSLAGNLKESLEAVADSKLNPIRYKLTSQMDSVSKIIEANIQKNNLNATVTEISNETLKSNIPDPKSGKPIEDPTQKSNPANTAAPAPKTERLQYKLQPPTYLSQSLTFALLRSKSGLKVGTTLTYRAIAEEDGKVYPGESWVATLEKMPNNTEVFKVINTFKGIRYISYLTHKGIMVQTKSPTQSLTVELSPNQDIATKGFEYNRSTLALLFKNIPETSSDADSIFAPPPATTPNQQPSPSKPKSVEDLQAPVAGDDMNKLDKTKLGTDSKETLPPGLSVPPGKGQ